MRTATVPLRRALAVLCLAAATASAAEIWVAPSGSDSNPGTEARPLASVTLALRRARDLRRTAPAPLVGPVHLVLRGGVYRLDEPLLVRPEDGGTAASPTIVEAAPGEHPVLSGGVRVSGWRRLTPDESPAGLPAVARGHVWAAPQPRFDGRWLEFRQLWIAGAKAVRARTPNRGSMIPLAGWDREHRTAVVPPGLALPSNLDGVEMVLLQQWEIAVLRLASHRVEAGRSLLTFSEPESRIEFEHPWPQPVFPPRFHTSPFYLVNSIAFLDSPGEWFEDTDAHRVYYWPRPGEDLACDPVTAPALATLVTIEGMPDRPVRNVEFKGIAFEDSTWMRPSVSGHVPLQAGMYMVDAYRIHPPGTPDWHKLDNQAWLGRPPAAVSAHDARVLSFDGCRFAHTAADGLDFVSGVQDSSVVGCTFRDIGINGLVAGAFADGGTEAHLPYNPADARVVCSRLRLADNLIVDCANEDWGGVALLAGFVNHVTIEHNDVIDTSYTGISVGWGWTRSANVSGDNLIRANLIRRAATRMSDTGGIYTLSSQRGTVVEDNVVEDIRMSPWVHDPEHWFYLYADEGTSGTTWRDNWIPSPRILKNANGPGNVWEDNGPQVSAAIKAAAGLEPAYRGLLSDGKTGDR